MFAFAEDQDNLNRQVISTIQILFTDGKSVYKDVNINHSSHKTLHSLQLFVHCDVVICDARNPLGGVCSGQCSNQGNGMKGKTCCRVMT